MHECLQKLDIQLLKTENQEQINKHWYIYTVEYYSAVKMKALLINATRWINLKCILLNERSLFSKGCMLSIYITFWKRQS